MVHPPSTPSLASSSMKPSMHDLNACSAAVFMARLGSVFEHAPWVAEAMLSLRPFVDADALHAAMMAALRTLPEADLVTLLRGHPELAGEQARRGGMTADSVAEQGSLALADVAGGEAARWDALNAAYRERFGFPFVLCIRRHTRDSALHAFEQRLRNERADELRHNLDEIARVSRLRLAARIADHRLDRIHGRLTTHVLDIARGRPARGMRITLHELQAGGRRLLADVLSNAQGSSDEPLLSGEPLRIGRYELQFHVGEYFAKAGGAADDPPFLDVVPVAFGIGEPEGDYHVPLTVTPWAYGTYRGS